MRLSCPDRQDAEDLANVFAMLGHLRTEVVNLGSQSLKLCLRAASDTWIGLRL